MISLSSSTEENKHGDGDIQTEKENHDLSFSFAHILCLPCCVSVGSLTVNQNAAFTSYPAAARLGAKPSVCVDALKLAFGAMGGPNSGHVCLCFWIL
jgi:hypothetical protein